MNDQTAILPTRSRLAVRSLLASLMLIAVILASVVSAGSGVSAQTGDHAVPMAMQGAAATPVGATPVAAPFDCNAIAPGTGAEAWVRSELYFGTTMPDGSVVTAEQWQAFLDEEITPRFPAGLTVLEGYGQFLNSSGVIIAEDSIVLIIFYPADAVAESNEGLEEIRDAYEVQFEQESVLRVDSAPICISF